MTKPGQEAMSDKERCPTCGELLKSGVGYLFCANPNCSARTAIHTEPQLDTTTAVPKPDKHQDSGANDRGQSVDCQGTVAGGQGELVDAHLDGLGSGESEPSSRTPSSTEANGANRLVATSPGPVAPEVEYVEDRIIETYAEMSRSVAPEVEGEVRLEAECERILYDSKRVLNHHDAPTPQAEEVAPTLRPWREVGTSESVVGPQGEVLTGHIGEDGRLVKVFYCEDDRMDWLALDPKADVRVLYMHRRLTPTIAQSDGTAGEVAEVKDLIPWVKDYPVESAEELVRLSTRVAELERDVERLEKAGLDACKLLRAEIDRTNALEADKINLSSECDAHEARADALQAQLDAIRGSEVVGYGPANIAKDLRAMRDRKIKDQEIGVTAHRVYEDDTALIAKPTPPEEGE